MDRAELSDFNLDYMVQPLSPLIPDGYASLRIKASSLSFNGNACPAHPSEVLWVCICPSPTSPVVLGFCG